MDYLEIEQRLLLNLPMEYFGIEWLEDKESLLKGVNWKVFKYLTKLHRLFPLAYTVFNMYMPEKVKKSFQEDFEKHSQWTDICLDEIENISKECKKENCKILIRKGAAISKVIYGDFYQRHFNDIDMLVLENQIKVVHKVLCNNQWKHGYYAGATSFNLLEEPTLRDKNSNEYFDYTKETPLGLLHIDLARKIKLVSQRHIELFFNDSVPLKNNIMMENIHCFFCELSINIFNNVSRWEGLLKNEISLRDFIDLYCFMKKYQDSIDWQKVKELLENLGVREYICEILFKLQLIYGDFLNTAVKNILFTTEYEMFTADSEEKHSLFKTIFNRTENSKKYVQMYKAKLADSKKDLPIINMEAFGSGKNSLLEEVHICDFKENLKINFQMNNGLLSICYFVPQEVYENLDNYIIETRIFNNNLNEESFFELIYIRAADGIVKYGHYNSSEYFDSCTKIREESYFLESENITEEVKKQKSCFFVKVTVDANKGIYEDGVLWACTSVLKKINKNVYHTLNDEHDLIDVSVMNG